MSYKINDWVMIKDKNKILAGDSLANGQLYQVINTFIWGEIVVKNEKGQSLIITPDEFQYTQKMIVKEAGELNKSKRQTSYSKFQSKRYTKGQIRNNTDDSIRIQVVYVKALDEYQVVILKDHKYPRDIGTVDNSRMEYWMKECPNIVK